MAETTGPRAPARALSRGLVPAVMVGTIAGLDNIATGLAIASLLFAGSLAAGLGLAVIVVFLGGGILALVVSLLSRQPNTIAMVQETTIAILAAALATHVATLAAPPEVKVITALTVLGGASIVTGILFWVTGQLRFGALARFLPFPVVAGFLAGSGWLLVAGAMTMATGEFELLPFVAALQHADIFYRVIPALAFAIVMLAALKRFPSPATVPLVMLLATFLFYIVLSAIGMDAETARAQGHLPHLPAAGSIIWPTTDLMAHIEWGAVAATLPSVLSAAALSMVGLLLNTSGQELATGRDIDANAELRGTGIANIISGSLGGPSGYVGLAMTLLADRMGVRGRSAGITCALVMFIGLFLAQPLISRIPVFLTSGFVLYLGLEMLKHWVVDTRRQLPVSEWVIVIAILAAVATIGFLEGMAAGLLISVVVFVFNYSRLPVVRMASTGTEHRSTVDRSPAAMEFLSRHGNAVEVVQLQGYLFFGTADRMVEHVRRRLAASDRGHLRFMVLDFRHVSGVDSAATTCFNRIKALIEPLGVKIFFTHTSPEVEQALRRGGLEFSDAGAMTLESDIDHALERVEEMLLCEEPELDAGRDLYNHLTAAIGPHPRMRDFIDAMTLLSLEPEDILIRAGEDADDVYFVADGRVRVQLTMPNGRVLRLRTMTGGAIVGEIALYRNKKRTADVIVETPSEIFRLSATDLNRLESEDGELAILAHRLLATNLAEKLSVTNRMIQNLHR